MSHFEGTEDFGGSDYPYDPSPGYKHGPITDGKDNRLGIRCFSEHLILTQEEEQMNVKRNEKAALMPSLSDLHGAQGSAGAECVPKDWRTGLPTPTTHTLLPVDAAERKAIPVASGVLDYFPSALIEVAKVSKYGNDQHNPGEPIHWARGKSMDQADSMMDHFLERGTLDSDGLRHSAKMVWRALAILQLEMEAAGAPIARGAR
jgi:hypothetical protein